MFKSIVLSSLLLSSVSFADQVDDFAQASFSKEIRLSENQKQDYINELTGVNSIKWFFWMTNSGRVFIADTRNGEDANSVTLWEHSLSNFTWTPISGGTVEKLFDTISISSDGRSITLGASSSSSSSSSATTSTGTLDAGTRSVSKYVVQMGNTYDDIGSAANGAAKGTTSITSAFSRSVRASAADLDAFTFNSGGDWKGSVGQINGVDTSIVMEFLKASDGSKITDDIRDASKYYDFTTQTPGPLFDLLNSSFSSIDLAKLKTRLTVNMGGDMTVSGSSVKMQPLVATIPMDSAGLDKEITFKTTAAMTLPDGSTMQMNNVQIKASATNPEGMTGSFDFAQTFEGEAYTGTGSFNINGCQGGEIFKGGSKVADIKLENGVFHVKSVDGSVDEVIEI